MVVPLDPEVHPTEIERIDVAPTNKRENRSLYQARVKIQPRLVHGTYRRLKWWIMAATLLVYYVTPWLRWDRGPGVPDQAVLIDFPGRRFYFFFIEIWPQEFFFVAGLLIMAGIGLFLTTSVAGRLWCGYFCPQTVWTDLFIFVERQIEGDRNARIRLDKAPMSFDKLWRRTAKHTVWLVIAMLTGGAWIFYFADAPTLAQGFVTLEAPGIAYMTVAALTFTTYVLGGHMREQVCTYMCPWPRIMGAMMDEESLVVAYRPNRGEPRGSVKSIAADAKLGDCVDCNACVAACPMGIDIRDGQQLECITCALCIDACDEVMDKLGRPLRLIGYASLAGEHRAAIGKGGDVRPIRPRTLAYFAAWSLAGLIMLYALVTRPEIEVNVLHDRNPLFVKLSDGAIRNAYSVKILNKSYATRSFNIAADGIPGAVVSVVGVSGVAGVVPVLTVDPDSLRSFRVHVTAPAKSFEGVSTDIAFSLHDINGGDAVHAETIFRGAEK